MRIAGKGYRARPTDLPAMSTQTTGSESAPSFVMPEVCRPVPTMPARPGIGIADSARDRQPRPSATGKVRALPQRPTAAAYLRRRPEALVTGRPMAARTASSVPTTRTRSLARVTAVYSNSLVSSGDSAGGRITVTAAN